VRKIKILDSQRIDLLIVDAENVEAIKLCIPSSVSFSILPVRNVIPIILNYSFFLKILSNVFNFKKLKEAVLFAIIDFLNPKVLITHIDNSSLMAKIHTEFPEKLTISVQNGFRCGLQYPSGSIYPAPVNIYYGFGDYEGKLYKKNDVVGMEYISAGSLTYDLYKKRCIESIEKKYDFCFVSQFIDNPSEEIPLNYADRIFSSLTKICNEYGYSLAVVLRSEDSTESYKSEVSHLRKIDTQGVAKLIPNNRATLKSYKTIESSKILITVHSTLGFEFFGAGKKVLFGASAIDFTLAKFWDAVGNFNNFPALNLLDDLTTESILNKLNTLMAIEDKEYIKKTKNARQYYMNYKADNSVSMLIEKKISKIFDLK
jgi:surface carbohydrate biosynthesis protein